MLIPTSDSKNEAAYQGGLGRFFTALGRLDIPYAQVNGEADAHARAFDRVLVEVQRSLDHFERNFSQLTVERVLLAPMAQCEALVAHIGANLQVPVAAMDLLDVMDLPPLYLAASPDRRAGWFRLIGEIVAPYLNLFRGLPLQTGGLDFTPMVAMFVLLIFRNLIGGGLSQ